MAKIAWLPMKIKRPFEKLLKGRLYLINYFVSDNPGQNQQDHAAGIEPDEAGYTGGDERVSGGEDSPKETLTDHTDRLHQYGFDQRDAVLDRVEQGNEIWHIPHKKKQADALDDTLPGYTV
jgi:hypothetical protein